ncbi:hypothetical protein MLD38_019166 [Melastoma candidum]|uniref:Uncharacterized protein n=1 Tax=Melastoma candidum TaxID=119954 RepID=A0ACB9QWR1_9MYRT|nr:hypothetical protein MLD38_019166 [Melastoma candidum]
MEIDGESSHSVKINDKPVIVRVKRKASQLPLDALWLEISERPSKRPYLDFDKLSISDTSKKVGEVGVQRLLVRHVESTNISGVSPELLQSFAFRLTELSEGSDDKRHVNKRKDTSEDQLIKARETKQRIPGDTCFKQIWSNREENELGRDGLYPDQSCQFYDIIRLDNMQEPEEMKAPGFMPLEDERILSSYLPLLRDFIPTAAAEIERDISAHTVDQGAVDDYVYDFYAMSAGMNECYENYPGEFPLVHLEEDNDLYDGPDEAEAESEDSNAEDNPKNDYPEEASEDSSEDTTARDDEEGDDTCSELDDHSDGDIALDEDLSEEIWSESDDDRSHYSY